MAAPEENNNAEKWTLEESTKLFDDAIKLSENENRDYDFIGEIARDLKQYKELFSYLSNKFPELKEIHNRLISNCEANCFYNGKKSNIVPSLAIMNLKSNHGWTDRNDVTTDGKELQQPPSSIKVKIIKSEDDE
jgi:hypothetical protein